MNTSLKRPISLYFFIAFIVLFFWCLGLGTTLYIHGKKLQSAKPPTYQKANAAVAAFREKYYSGNIETVTLTELLPCVQYVCQPPAIAARAAVVIDAENGGLLFAKNPDQSIPPASLTKLVTIYTAMQAVENGEISLTDSLPPPPESWAVNIPAGSSLMFLGKNQRVTVEELILGMSVVSGNDAAIALAIHTAGSVAAFVARMNNAIKELGLEHTHFEDPSGLSEHNRTTARDFARFSAFYIKKHPDHLERFHSVREFTYPKPHNALTAQTPIKQQATNTLLAKLDGCDGLKTGFIHESGFNIALTTQRNGIRFIAVILGGAGNTSTQGKRIREHNGMVLMDWAFSNFFTVFVEDVYTQPAAIPVLGSNDKTGASAVTPLLAGYAAGQKPSFTVAQNQSTLPPAAIRSRFLLPVYLSAPISMGQKIGKIQFLTNTGDKEYIAAEFPLIADRSIEKGSSLRWRYDNIALRFYLFIRRLTPFLRC